MPGFGFGYRFSRRNSLAFGGSGGNVEVLYGPNYGPKGPTKVLVTIWVQAPVGYCYETNNYSEDLYAKWKSRGVNCVKPGHDDAVLQGQGTNLLAAVKANNLMLISEPTWRQFHEPRPNPEDFDRRELAINDPYWRVNWIAYMILDEPDLLPYPLSTHVAFLNTFALEGVTKPITANFTRRVASPGTPDGSASILWKQAFEVQQISALSQDTYQFHLLSTTANSVTEIPSNPQYHLSSWNYGGVGLETTAGKRFTSSYAGMATHLMRNGPVMPGRSDTGELPVDYPAIAFNNPPFSVQGNPIPPQPLAYAPGDKSLGHYCATGRVDLGPGYPQGGLHAPARFFRDECWVGFVHGSCHLLLFPQTVSDIIVTGYVDSVTNRLSVTVPNSRPAGFTPNIGGAMEVLNGFNVIGFIDRDNPQVSGTPGGAGIYRLDPTKQPTIGRGSAGAPVQINLRAASKSWGDDTDPANAAELTNAVANLTRMQAHPTGGNLLMNSAFGGRRDFIVLRCPDVNGDAGLFKEDLTLAPVQAGYTSGGEPIIEASGAPMWEFGWPMGFEGFHVRGDDDATYIYIKSMSNSNQPTWFPGFSALGLPARVFGPFELAGFRRIGAGAAVEMAGASGVLKAGIDEGAATWFFIESVSITQSEGNSGSAAYAIAVRRGGNVSGANTVTATVSGTGISPATAADFAGGSFPSDVLSFAAGETDKVFTVRAAGEAVAESDESFKVTLSAPSGGAALVGSNKSEIACGITNDDAAVASAFVWLVGTMTSAPSLPGAPAEATYLRPVDTAFITRGGIRMRSISGGTTASNSGGFASVPYWLNTSIFNSVEFELAAGNWEFGVLVSGNAAGATLSVIESPDEAANVRQSIALSGASSSISDTDGTIYTNPTNAVSQAVNSLTFVPVTVTDSGGGVGLVRVYASGGAGTLLAAIALRKI